MAFLLKILKLFPLISDSTLSWRAEAAFLFIHFDGHQHGVELLLGIASFDQDYRVEGQKYAVESHKAIKHVQERHEA